MTMAILWGLLYWHEKKLTRRHGSVMRSCAWQASRPVDALAKELGGDGEFQWFLEYGYMALFENGVYPVYPPFTAI